MAGSSGAARRPIIAGILAQRIWQLLARAFVGLRIQLPGDLFYPRSPDT
jgi:hypothetical protein